MSDYEGRDGAQPQVGASRPRLVDYADMAAVKKRAGTPEVVPVGPPADSSAPRPGPPTPPPAATAARDAPGEDPLITGRRLEFMALLEKFRATPVLVPLGSSQSPSAESGFLTADMNGIRFILAFSDQQALARYARAQGVFHSEWSYQTVLGARLLDVAVPAAGVPCGVALDCADGAEGLVLPPVKGIVPDEAAIDAYTER
ncbi:hypothetical protein [Streptomyces sp. NPDC059258]|uniref:hypothetical protein n=1 Tax=unclassified Streptomyces TaxID=2593676 RepID=UPI0036A26F73